MLRGPLVTSVMIFFLILLTSVTTSAQSPPPTPPKGKGQILVKVLDADGNTINFKGNLFFSVYPAKQEGSTIAKTGVKVICSEQEYSARLFPERPFCVTPGKYLLEENWFYSYRDYEGYHLPIEQRFFEVKEGQTETRVISLGLLQIIIRTHDNKLVPDARFWLREVKIDANGVAFPGENSVGSLFTGDFGRASANITPGKYFIIPAPRSQNPALDSVWFFKDHVGDVVRVLPGQKQVIDLTLGRLDYVPRKSDSSLVKAGSVVVYKPRLDANGNPVAPNWVLHNYAEGPHRGVTDTGIAGFDILPGTYSVMYSLDSYRKPTFEHGVKVEPGVRLLLSNLKDWDISGGHYYTQTGRNLGGFRVTNEGGIAFWNEFQRLGGLELLGYPVSNRYFFEGTFMQAFQKAILKWDAESGGVKFYPVLEQISLLVGDEWLYQRSVPTAVVFFEDEEESLTLLDSFPSIKEKFFANPFGEEPYPYWREHYGYPSGSNEYNAFIALRTSNALFQLWTVDIPGIAKAGEVTLMNVGDLAKEAGIIPKEASIPGPPN